MDMTKEVLNIYNTQKILLQIGGFGRSRKPGYIIYIAGLFLVLIYVFMMAIYAAYLVIPEKAMVIDAFHIGIVCLSSIAGLLGRLLTDRWLNKTNSLIDSGIFQYENPDDEEKSIRSGIAEEIGKKVTLFYVLFLSGCVSNLTLFPITQTIFFTEEGNYTIKNPYLPPYFYYMPFNTRTFLGYSAAYALDIIMLIAIYGIDMSMIVVIIICTVQIKVHMKVLNHSIKNIRKRAYMKYRKNNNTIFNQRTSEEFPNASEYQSCLYSCLRENIRHHHALMRFKKAFQPFYGACLLNIFTMASIMFAAVLYLLLENLPANQLVNYVLVLFGEQMFVFTICLNGEEITDESSRLFEALYDIPWFQCNKSFNKALSIMMCNTVEPIRVKAIIIDGTASVKTYGDIMTAMYKIMNLWRQSDQG